MKIAVIGTGYVGLVLGTCFSDMGNDVWCIDKNEKRIDSLKKGIIPIYEKGLENLVKKNYNQKRLHFDTNLLDGLKEALFIFIAVGTPPNEDGSADLQHVLKVAEEIGKNIDEYKIIINKSTVPVGTAEKVKGEIDRQLQKRGISIDFDVVSNPEFLKEGDAVQDFMSPDRVIIGTSSEKAANYLKELYSVFFKQHPRIIFMDEKSAEVTKYASNAMLATKISFMNEMANFCEKVDADVEMVRLGIGADSRIGYSFIYPGIGYGGSCFPKDVKAIIHTAKKHDYDMRLLNAVEEVNNTQKIKLFNKIKKYFKDRNETLMGKRIAIWGLSFKPETDDMREAPSQVIIKCLLKEGALVQVHDQKALDEAKRFFKDFNGEIKYFENNYDCLIDCDAMALLTEWHIYRQPDFEKIKSNLKYPLIFDGRNQYDPVEMKNLGIEYYCIGRK